MPIYLVFTSPPASTNNLIASLFDTLTANISGDIAGLPPILPPLLTSAPASINCFKALLFIAPTDAKTKVCP